MTFLLSMTSKELDRYAVIKKLLKKETNGPGAAEVLDLSVRQIRRLKAKVKRKGARGLIHGHRGKPGNRGLPEKERERIIKHLHEYYPDFKPGFACEKLAERHNIKRDPKTIRQIMVSEGLWRPKVRRARQKHLSWRQRKAHFGELEQFDGSYEHWFEDRAESCCLLASIDDAKGEITHARFGLHEGVKPVFNFWHGYLDKNGKPRAIYLDKFSTYKMNPGVARENHDLRTQFERAMHQLGIEPITAHSPQAKGRIERLFNTLQDRLIKELRLAGISTVPEANRFLDKIFIPKFNAQFSVAPRAKANLHRKLTPREHQYLDSVLARQEQRVVHNDFTVSYQNKWYQLLENQPRTVCKRDTVTIEERLDGEIKICSRGAYLNYKVLPERPQRQNERLWVLAATRQPVKPAVNHPWRRRIQAEVLTKTTPK